MGAEEDGSRAEPEEMSFAKHSIWIEGKRYRLVRYGEEVDDEGRDFFSTPCHICGTPPEALHARGCPMGAGRPNSRPPLCRDCGTAVGHIHKLGCGIEQCPRCRRQYMSCSCESNEDDPDPGELKSANCWERSDRIRDDPTLTVFRRRARLSQAKWREARGLPIGDQPISGGPGSRKLGSRIELGYARATGANLITEAARKAARDRVAAPEPHQMLNADRLWADLLSSAPMCFNLFGDLAADTEAADIAVHAWWPDAPGRVAEVRFEWSPGRLDPNYLGNRSAFDVAFLLDLGEGRRGVVCVETKYHEVATKEGAPKQHRLERYESVARSSRVFSDNPSGAVVGTDLQQLWLDHLLALSMLQHPEEPWGWARLVLVHPERNTSFEGAANRYRKLLRDESSFQATTLEEMVATPHALPSTAAKAFRSRYLGP